MESSFHCLPCFLRQTIKAAGLSTRDTTLQKEILDAIARLLPDLDLHRSPPENSVPVYETIARLSRCKDPFAELKEASNIFAMDLRQEVRKAIDTGSPSLFTALLFAIAGNIIDYGSQQDFDAHQALKKCLNTPLAINHYPALNQALAAAEHILYLGDNAGEIVFDSLVIETIQRHMPGKEIIFAVKERPIINDALAADAQTCGLPELCRVISNGTGCPGTPLAHCSREFQDIFDRADLIISKGQGNYETLSNVEAPLFFLLTVKCPLVGSHISRQTGMAVDNGQLILLQSPHYRVKFKH